MFYISHIDLSMWVTSLVDFDHTTPLSMGFLPGRLIAYALTFSSNWRYNLSKQQLLLFFGALSFDGLRLTAVFCEIR